jgi:hypothetical protein
MAKTRVVERKWTYGNEGGWEEAEGDDGNGPHGGAVDLRSPADVYRHAAVELSNSVERLKCITC